LARSNSTPPRPIERSNTSPIWTHRHAKLIEEENEFGVNRRKIKCLVVCEDGSVCTYTTVYSTTRTFIEHMRSRHDITYNTDGLFLFIFL
jgi:hypothetical protein